MTKEHKVLEELKALSAKIGADPLLVQGAGGNSSLKEKDSLWVKASGTWLKDALTKEIFVEVDRNFVLKKISEGDVESIAAKSSKLKPSIETSLHAVMPHKIVIHVHSINTLAWAVRKDGKAELEKLLSGLSWAWIPYVRPGLPLTLAIQQVISKKPDILIIANHGLVIGAEDCKTAENLLNEIERRLNNIPRNFQQAGINLKLDGYRLPINNICHSIATDEINLRIARGGSLYPDHVVFLGPAICEDAKKRPTLLVVPNKAILVREDISAGAEAMVEALAYLLLRIDSKSEINYLSESDEQELLEWSAEKYRQEIGKK